MDVASLLFAATLAAAPAADPAPDVAEYGPHPQLVAPDKKLIPTMKIAPARGWRGDAQPQAAPGFAVNQFAGDLAHPRNVYVLPNGDVLVAETDTPDKPEDYQGIKGKISKHTQQRAGSGHGSANRLMLLRDADGDGVAEMKNVFLDGLNSPYGVALVGDTLYVANTDALVKVPYRSGATKIDKEPVKVADLPGGPINHHWTKSLVASRDGRHLYVGVGSNSNAGERGIEAEKDRAAILEVDPASGATRVFASGLRNPNGLAFNPGSGELWTSVNERDELGDEVPPDYMTSVKDGAFYGFPYSYYGDHVDARMQPPRPDLVAKAIAPDYALGAHTASLGLAFYDGDAFPARFRGGAFVGQHGSWNRTRLSGYKVIFVPFANGRPDGMPEDVLTGFVDAAGDAQGRPVGVAVDKRGALLVADDVGGRVWRVSAAAPR
jgi:glucose/arabinose dehydrogenase